MPNLGALLDDEETGRQAGQGPVQTPRPTEGAVLGATIADDAVADRRGRRRRTQSPGAPLSPPQVEVPWWRIETEEEEGLSRVFWVYTDFDLSDDDVSFAGVLNVPGVTRAVMPANSALRGQDHYDRGSRAVKVTHRAILSHEDCVRAVVAALAVERTGAPRKRAQRESERSRADARRSRLWKLFGVNPWTVSVWALMLLVGFVMFGLGLTWNRFVWSVLVMGIIWLAGTIARAVYLSDTNSW